MKRYAEERKQAVNMGSPNVSRQSIAASRRLENGLAIGPLCAIADVENYPQQESPACIEGQSTFTKKSGLLG